MHAAARAAGGVLSDGHLEDGVAPLDRDELGAEERPAAVGGLDLSQRHKPAHVIRHGGKAYRATSQLRGDRVPPADF